MERARRATNEENKIDRAQKIRVETLEEIESLTLILWHLRIRLAIHGRLHYIISPKIDLRERKCTNILNSAVWSQK